MNTTENMMTFKFKATVDTSDTIAGKVYTQSKPDKNVGGSKSCGYLRYGHSDDDGHAIGIIKGTYNTIQNNLCYVSYTHEGAEEAGTKHHMVYVGVLSGTGDSDELLIKIGDPASLGFQMRPLAIGEGMMIPYEHSVGNTYDIMYLKDANYSAGVSELTVETMIMGY